MPSRKRAEKGEGTQRDTKAGVDSSPPSTDSQEPSAQPEDGGGRMTFQPSIYRQRKRSGGVKWFPVFKRLFYVSLLVLVPMILNYAALNQEARVLPPQGSVVYDIGWGQKLLLHCMGSGVPTVILDAPIGQASHVWSRVQPLLARQTKVCSYDRSGLGFSDRAYQNTSKYTDDYGESTRERDRTLPSTVERMVEDLHKLLTVASSQPKPFLLVSSDFTTLVSRFYAQLYEYELAGLFLIDPAAETLFEANSDADSQSQNSIPQDEEELEKSEFKTPWSHYWYRKTVPHLQSVHMSGSLGFNRLGLMVGLMSALEVPELQTILTDDVIAIKKHLLCQPKHLSSAFDEYYFINETISQFKTMFQLKPFPELLPITIATFREVNSNIPLELTKIWATEQERMIEVVHPNSHKVTLPGSDYLTLYQKPQAVVTAVMDMVVEWRGRSHVAQ